MSKPVPHLRRNGARRHDVKQSSEERGGLTVFAAECSCGWQTEASLAALVSFRVRQHCPALFPVPGRQVG
jgi:hypothetical protein